MTMGRKPQPTAHGIITSSLHHQQSEPGSLVIPILIYTQNRDILHRARGDESLHCWFEQCLCRHADALVLRCWPVETVGTVPVIRISTTPVSV